MTTFNTISDLARSYQLRMSQTALKSRLASVSQEATTGIKSDIALALNGDLSRISQIENRISVLGTYESNLTEAQGILAGMQTALDRIQSIATACGPALISDALVSSPSTLDVYVNKAPQDLEAVMGALNTAVGGRHVFSGSRTDHPAVINPTAMLDQITLAVGGATTTAAIIAGFDAYFDPPALGGFSDLAFTGNDQGENAITISPGASITAGVTANSPELRTVLKGFSIMAYLARTPGLSHDTRRDLSRAAGQMLVEGEARMTEARTAIGVQEELAAKTLTAHQAESSALAVARNTLVASDPYEAAAALTELESNLETLYAVTARLSRLSLMDYL